MNRSKYFFLSFFTLKDGALHRPAFCGLPILKLYLKSDMNVCKSANHKRKVHNDLFVEFYKAVQLCCLNSYHTKYVLILLHAKVCELISRTNEKSANPYG